MQLVVRLMCVCLAVVSVAVVANASIAHSLPSTDPAHAGKCWNPDTKTLHTVGEVYTEKSSCTRVECNNDFSMTWSTCGVIGFSGDECKPVEGDKTKDYPDCCPTIKC